VPTNKNQRNATKSKNTANFSSTIQPTTSYISTITFIIPTITHHTTFSNPQTAMQVIA
jgi:hypothetical protein